MQNGWLLGGESYRESCTLSIRLSKCGTAAHQRITNVGRPRAPPGAFVRLGGTVCALTPGTRPLHAWSAAWRRARRSATAPTVRCRGEDAQLSCARVCLPTSRTTSLRVAVLLHSSLGPPSPAPVRMPDRSDVGIPKSPPRPARGHGYGLR
jgi:hypothetical protein